MVQSGRMRTVRVRDTVLWEEEKHVKGRKDVSSVNSGLSLARIRLKER